MMNRNQAFAATVETFLLNVHHARMSSDERLRFATGSKHCPSTVTGLAKKGIRELKFNVGKNRNTA